MFQRTHAAVLALTLAGVSAGGSQTPFNGSISRFDAEIIVNGLKVPSAMAFLPDGRALVAERAIGAIDVIDVERRSAARAGDGPHALTGEDAGIHDIVLHPEYASNGWIYVSYSEGDPSRSTTVVDRMRLHADRFVDRERIFTADAYSEDRYHYGGRIVFANGYMFLPIGDRHHESRAQLLSSDAGKILRLRDDGSVPPDNPFIGTENARPEIWTYGHRHPQGPGGQSARWTSLGT